MVNRIDPKLGESILDPACGTGGFLSNAFDHVKNNYVKTGADQQTLQKQIHGVEKKQLPYLLCTTNMLLHGIEVPVQIKHDNTLNKPLSSWDEDEQMDVIITNPPFGEGVKTKIKKLLTEECNLHTIVRLPNGVFNPYTGIKTNILFFTKQEHTKGKPSKYIWFYEHPYPEGIKNYNKTKPMKFEEFQIEMDWWIFLLHYTINSKNRLVSYKNS